MPKVELTIKPDYLPLWGTTEGVREILQNGKDGETEYSAELKVEWKGGTLSIENTGVTLPINALLFGHTTKLGRGDMIGKFGEGLKLGMLALVRAGHSVKIRTGSEVWTPILEKSELFGTDVLVVNIDRGREPKNRIRVEIRGISESQWEEIRGSFLFLQKPKKGTYVDTSGGRLLLSDEHLGKVFVKGIFVKKHPELHFGYDLLDIELDRDRKMVDDWSLQYKTRSVLAEAMGSSDDLLSAFEDMLSANSAEVKLIDSSNASYSIPRNAATFIAAKFLRDNGSNAVPVCTLGESVEIEHLGKKPVIVSKQRAAVLETVLGSVMEIKSKLSSEEVCRYGWTDLEVGEKENLLRAIRVVSEASPVSVDDIEIVDFRSSGLLGQFRNGRVFLARKILANHGETITTLVHEVAHNSGGDGTKSHVECIENIWTKIYLNLA